MAALITVASQVVMAVLVLVAVNNIVMGELGEVLDRIFDPEGFDTLENEAYFESLELDLSPINFALIALALLIGWVVGNLGQVAVTRLALSDLKDHTLSVSDAFKQALPRVPRLMGVQIQLLAIFGVAAVLAMVVQGILVVRLGAIGWLLLILLVPAFIVGAVYAIVVAPLAYVVASAGPRIWSLPYGARLVRGRFWASLGRMMLVIVVILAISFAVGVPFAIAGFAAGPAFQLVSQSVQAVVGAALGILGIVAPAILYHDLDGESDSGDLAGSGGESDWGSSRQRRRVRLRGSSR